MTTIEEMNANKISEPEASSRLSRRERDIAMSFLDWRLIVAGLGAALWWMLARRHRNGLLTKPAAAARPRTPFQRGICLAALLSTIGLCSAPLPIRAAAGSQSANFEVIDAYVTSEMQAVGIPGIALGIVRGDQVVHTKGFGVANPAGQPLTPQTPLILGSTSKSFTALAIMQLVEAGRISLDAPVRHYLPWFQVGTPVEASTITVRHLLTQVSGIPTRAVTDASLAGNGDETLEEQVRALNQVALTAPVGSTYQYSNLNYTTLGLVVESVAGQSYGSYVQEHIFAPLQMQQSYVSEREASQHGLATGYRWWFGLAVPATVPYLSGSMPAGFLISSAQDMTHYLLAQLNNGRYQDATVLSAGGIAQLHRPAALIDLQGHAYGMGWVINLRGEPTIWHAGDTANYHSDMLIAPREQWAVVMLTNINGRIGDSTNAQGHIAQGVLNLLLGQQPSSGSSFGQIYIVFDALLLLCSALALWSLVRLLRGRKLPLQRRPWSLLSKLALPLLWELVLPLWILVSMPAMLQATWPLTLLYFPDLGYWLLAMCFLLLATGSIRLVLARSRLQRRDLQISAVAPIAT